MKCFKLLVWGVIVMTVMSGMAQATPSTQIWIPSTDVQAFKVVHFGFDTYIKTESQDNGVTEPTVTNLGLTAGVLPWQKLQMEVGVDYRDVGGNHTYPLLFNAKFGTPEEALFKYAPALAIGGYDFGTKKDLTDANIVYALAAKNIGKLGRFSAGYYIGNDQVLRDINGNKDNDGLLLSWDRTITEISDKLWVAVDYQGGKNSYGAWSAGVAWKFAPNVGVILGYDIYNESAFKPTATVQLDIDF